ncbi:MAG: hypothetical protein M3155_08340, partial [Actinomycetota bacterium]|nr:hypothetical protein [Actinomycetota bacterium]
MADVQNRGVPALRHDGLGAECRLCQPAPLALTQQAQQRDRSRARSEAGIAEAAQPVTAHDVDKLGRPDELAPVVEIWRHESRPRPFLQQLDDDYAAPQRAVDRVVHVEAPGIRTRLVSEMTCSR